MPTLPRKHMYRHYMSWGTRAHNLHALGASPSSYVHNLCPQWLGSYPSRHHWMEPRIQNHVPNISTYAIWRDKPSGDLDSELSSSRVCTIYFKWYERLKLLRLIGAALQFFNSTQKVFQARAWRWCRLKLGETVRAFGQQMLQLAIDMLLEGQHLWFDHFLDCVCIQFFQDVSRASDLIIQRLLKWTRGFDGVKQVFKWSYLRIRCSLWWMMMMVSRRRRRVYLLLLRLHNWRS